MSAAYFPVITRLAHTRSSNSRRRLAADRQRYLAHGTGGHGLEQAPIDGLCACYSNLLLAPRRSDSCRDSSRAVRTDTPRCRATLRPCCLGPRIGAVCVRSGATVHRPSMTRIRPAAAAFGAPTPGRHMPCCSCWTRSRTSVSILFARITRWRWSRTILAFGTARRIPMHTV